MNAPQKFDFEGHQVRTHIDESGAPWFSAKDVCEILGINQYRNAIDKLRGNERAVILLNASLKEAVVSEAGLYRIIFRSSKPSAVRFQDWVFTEVLPQIRKTGGYSTTGEWVAARKEGKGVRRITTDVYKTFIEYAIRQGSQSADKYFIHFSNMVNTALLEIEKENKPSNLRDLLNTAQLHQLSVAEQIITKSLVECMARNQFYKDSYKIAKERIQVYASTIGRSRIGTSDRQTLGLMAGCSK